MADEVQEVQAEVIAEKKSGLSIKKILMVGVPVFLIQLLLAYVIVSKVFKPKLMPLSQAAAEEAKKKKSKKNYKMGEIYLVDDVIVNPKDTFGKRFINVSVAFECKNGKVLKELEKWDVRIRDYLITAFTSRTIEQLDDVQDKNSLRAEIKDHVNKMLPDGGIVGVYFSNFIIQ